MVDTHYERLSFFDTTYLALERRNSYMHIAAIQVFEAQPLLRADGGIDIDRIRAFVASRLHLIPRYRQRLAWVPIDRFPVWVDDEHFNLEYHVKHTALPKPGTEADLKRLAARVFAQQLDRSRPLWELWIVEGLEGDHFAIVGKVHHSMIDGMAGVDLLKVLLNLYPTDEIEEVQPWEPRPAPSDSKLLVDEAFRLARMPLGSMRTARDVVIGGPAARDEVRAKLEAAWRTARSGWFTRSATTPINRKLSPHRRFEWLTVDLDEVKEIKNSLGGTVNDVLLSAVAGAVRHYFAEREVEFEDTHYRIMVPVSIRPDDGAPATGNQVAMWLVDLPVTEDDPVRRLAELRETTARLKDDDAALGAAVLTQSASWMPLNLLSLGVRLMWSAARPFNMTVTNVPGPQIPLYLLGSRLVVQYPMVPLYMDHGIGVALFSYVGEVAWGLSADYELVPDLDRFVEAIRSSHHELLAAARDAAKPKAPARKRSGRAPAARKAPARKAPAKAAPVGKAPVKKAPAKAATAGKAPAKAAAAKAAPARKAPAKAAPTKKAPARTAAAKKAPATRPAAKRATGAGGTGDPPPPNGDHAPRTD